MSTLVLTLPSNSGVFNNYIDASRNGFGIVLMQHGKMISYASHQLKLFEIIWKKYPTHDLELATIVYSDITFTVSLVRYLLTIKVLNKSLHKKD